MKKKQLSELITKNTQDLVSKVAELEKVIVVERFNLNMGKAKNVHSIKNRKRDIAQIKTILKMKELTQNESNYK